MNEPTSESVEPWLDAALSRVLVPPLLPADFHRQLQAALARAETREAGAKHALAEREQRERLAALDANYLRLRRRTVGILIGASFAAGAVVALSMPWLQATFGIHTPLVLAVGGAVIALAIALQGWRARDLIPPSDLTRWT